MILSAMLREDHKRRIRAKLADGTRVVALTTLVKPNELLHIVAEALRPK